MMIPNEPRRRTEDPLNLRSLPLAEPPRDGWADVEAALLDQGRRGRLLRVGGGLLAAPGFIGFNVEERYQAMIDRFEQAGFQVIDKRYERGWLGAAAETRFRTRLPHHRMADGQDKVF